MKQQTLRIGFVGAGANTTGRHIPGFQEIDDVELSVVANRSRESAQKVADRFGIPQVADHWREVVENEAVDAVCIGTWPNLHAEVTIAALQAGKHVLTEARMARDLPEAEAMAEEAGRHPDLVTQIVPAPMSLAHDATIARLLQSADVGTLREVRVADCHGAAAVSDAPLTWRQDKILSGLNTMMMGIHYESVQRLLVDRDPQWVQADASVFTPVRKDSNGRKVAIDVPESITVQAGYDDDLRLLMALTSVQSGPPLRGWWFNGSGGSLRYDIDSSSLYYSRAGSSDESLVEPDEGTAVGWQVEADFVRSIRQGTPVTRTPFAEGLRYMRFTQRVYESWSAGGVKVAW